MVNQVPGEGCLLNASHFGSARLPHPCLCYESPPAVHERQLRVLSCSLSPYFVASLLLPVLRYTGVLHHRSNS